MATHVTAETMAARYSHPAPASFHHCRQTARARGAATPPRFLSQFDQDCWVDTAHLRHLNRRGVFVDLAADDAVHIRNTVGGGGGGGGGGGRPPPASVRACGPGLALRAPAERMWARN